MQSQWPGQIWVVLILCAASSASGADDCTGVPGTYSDAFQALKESYEPYVRSTPRTVSFYHYGWRTVRSPDELKQNWGGTPISSTDNPNDFSGPIELDPKIVERGRPVRLAERYFKRKAAGHFESISSQTFGEGLFASSDPLQSVDYSGNPGLLLRVGVPAGIRYLDFREPGQVFPFSPENSRRLNCFLSCGSGDCNSISGPQYLRLGKDVGRKLGVAFILYHWRQSPYSECRDLNQHSMADAIFIDPEFSDAFELAMFVPKLEERPSPAKLHAYSEVLNFFDSVELGQNWTAKPAFWDYYRAWAFKVHGLGPGNDLNAFQQHRSQVLRDSRVQMTSGTFGCSADPANRQELFSGRAMR